MHKSKCPIIGKLDNNYEVNCQLKITNNGKNSTEDLSLKILFIIVDRPGNSLKLSIVKTFDTYAVKLGYNEQLGTGKICSL